jgi:formylglycine-generating enzyme required for sulfatase activity
VKGLSPDWDDLIAGCLEEDAAERTASMSEVAAGLNDLASQENRLTEKAVTDGSSSTSFPKLSIPSTMPVSGEPVTTSSSGNSSPLKEWQADLGGGVKMAFMPVAAGSFMMGSDDGDSDEKPVHRVTISRSFWMGKYEVTNGEYQQFLKDTGYNGKDDADGDYLRHHRDWDKYASTGAKYPIVAVSWKNAAAFSKWLTDKEGRAGLLPPDYEYRLPTEAEWEYAARGGAKSKRYKYSGSDNAGDVAWFSDNSRGLFKVKRAHRVGGKLVNELGLYDYSKAAAGMRLQDSAMCITGDFTKRMQISAILVSG